MSLRGGYVLRQIYRYKRARPCISFLRCRRKSATNPQRNGTARVMLFMSSRAFPPRAQSVQEWHLTAMRFSLSLKIVLRTHADIGYKGFRTDSRGSVVERSSQIATFSK